MAGASRTPALDHSTISLALLAISSRSPSPEVRINQKSRARPENLDLQLQALKKAGCRRILQEKISASARNRPESQRMLDQVRDGDILVVWKLDRLARSTRDLLETMETIRGAGGKFQSLSEPWADTTSHAGKMNDYFRRDRR
jgi:DNA invertase Pin-like site-specific DNA recombinase